MREHGSRQEESHVSVDVVVDQERSQTGQSTDVVVNAQVRRQKGAQLHQRVLALIVQFTHQLFQTNPISYQEHNHNDQLDAS